MYFFVGGGVGIKGTDVWPSLSPHRAPAESGEAASRAPQWQGAPRAGTVLRVSQGGLAGVLTPPQEGRGPKPAGGDTQYTLLSQGRGLRTSGEGLQREAT